MKQQTAAEIGRLRVVKKLAPTSRGAIRLAERYGDTLMCVRHRVDAKARYRYTSVELLVACEAIKPRSQKMVDVQINWSEHSLRELVRAAGARWDPIERVWRMPKRLAGILRLTNRLVP